LPFSPCSLILAFFVLPFTRCISLLNAICTHVFPSWPFSLRPPRKWHFPHYLLSSSPFNLLVNYTPLTLHRAVTSYILAPPALFGPLCLVLAIPLHIFLIARSLYTFPALSFFVAFLA
jgi:hypothetical protein